MQTRHFPALAAVALALAATSAAAQDAADPAIDTDGDGAYSFPELTAAYPSLTAADFAGIDANGDGLADMAEIAAAVAAGTLPAREG